MRASLTLIAFLSLLMTFPARAQSISGTWQGMAGWKRVLKVVEAPDGSLSGGFYNIAASRDPGVLPITGHVSKRTIEFMTWSAIFRGTLSADGKSIVGAFQSSTPPQPLTLSRATPKTAWAVDSTPHAVRKVAVADGVSLEVLDWGGRGQTLVLLAGNYNTAHVFDEFAPGLTAKYHVYGITRRGFGTSSAPPPTMDNYNSDRLGDDVLAVLDSLKIDRPVLVGHSIAGAEMSSIGTRHPEKVSGLVYLDAGYDWAFYEPASPTSFDADTNILARDFSQLQATEPSQKQALIKEIQNILPMFEKGLQWFAKEAATEADWPFIPSPQARIGEAIVADTLKYTGVKSPFVVIYASPHQCQPNCAVNPDSYEAAFPSQIAAVAAEYPNAHIIRLPEANHYVFRSNQADVLREIDAFMAGLPPR